jgi:hypothetical protein
MAIQERIGCRPRIHRRVVSVNSTDAKGQDQFEMGDRILLVGFG